MASNEFLWKPVSESDGRLVVLTPNKYNGLIDQVYVVTPDGQRVQGRFAGNQHNGQRGHFRFPQPGQAFPSGSYVLMTLDNGQTVQWGIGNPGSRNTGGTGQVGSAGAPPPSGGGGSVGTAESGPGFAFPQSDFSGLGFSPISPSFLPQVQVPNVDPIEATGEAGAFNVPQFQENLQTGSQNALDLTQLEFQGLENFNKQARELQKEGIIDENAFNKLQIAAANDFNRSQIPAANEFNQEQIGEANVFNQGQRLKQLETALPGARETILRQVERGNTLAEGRFVSDAEDRAFEVAARNASAEGTVVRGFGDDSVFGRRASDLLSAEQRLNLSQVGEQTLDRFLTLGANLAFDQPIKQNPILDQPLRFQPQQATTAQDIPGAPARPASELAVQQQNSLNELTTITPAQSIQTQVGQNEFQANLSQRTNEFNSRLDFESQRFNSETGLQIDLEQLYADVFNSQQEANAINQGIGVDLAQQGFGEGQDLTTDGGVGQLLGAAGSFLFGANSGGLLGALGLSGSEAATGGVVAGGTGATAGALSVGGQAVVGSAATASGAPGYLLADGSVVAASEVAAEGGTLSLPSLGSAATPLTIAAAAIASGRGIYETVQGLTDGTITEQDVKNGLAGTFGGFLPQGVNEILGKPISRNDIANAALLANPVTAPIALADMVLGLDLGFGSGKSEDQQARDSLRDFSENLGLFFKPSDEQAEAQGLKTSDHYVELVDGSYYDVGLDGGHKIPNYGLNVDGKGERHAYDIDWSDPRASEIVGYLNPLAFMVYGENAHRMMGHLWNASTSNNRTLSESKDNVRYWADTIGLDYETGVRLLKQYKDKGNISQDHYLAFLNGWNELMLTQGVPSEIAV